MPQHQPPTAEEAAEEAPPLSPPPYLLEGGGGLGGRSPVPMKTNAGPLPPSAPQRRRQRVSRAGPLCDGIPGPGPCVPRPAAAVEGALQTARPLGWGLGGGGGAANEEEIMKLDPKQTQIAEKGQIDALHKLT